MQNELKKFKILTLNCNSIRTLQRRAQFYQILDHSKPDFVLLQETALLAFHKVRHTHYKDYRTHSTNDKNGTAILYNNKYKTYRTDLNISLQHTAAVVELDNRKTMLLVSLYVPSDLQATSHKKILDDIRKITDRHDYWIVGGDMNARHIQWDKVTNLNGSILKKWADNNIDACTLVTSDEPTYPRTESTLDHFLVGTSFPTHGHRKKTEPTYSDHSLFMLELNPGDSMRFLEQLPPTYRDFANVNWIRFTAEVRSDLEEIDIPTTRTLSNKEIDDLIGSVGEVINKHTDRHVKKKPISYRHKNITTDDMTLISLRRTLKKRLMRENKKPTPDQTYRLSLKQSINALNANIDKQIRGNLKRNFQSSLEAIKPGSDMFREVNRLTGRKAFAGIEEVTSDGKSITRPEDIAKTFAKFYKGLYKKVTPQNSPEEVQKSTARRRTNFESFSTTCPSDNPKTEPYTSPEQVRLIVRSLNSKRSSGPDGISNAILKKLPASFCNVLSTVINNCIARGYFPAAWKSADIWPIEKKAGKKAPEDFRPISLTSNMGKIFEQIILDHMTYILDDKKTIPDHQFGFRKGHSTTDALCVLRDRATEAFRDRKTLAACFLDIEKAFDSVWTDGLIYKISNIGFHPKITETLTSFLTDRKARVAIGKEKTTYFPTKRGVPQGTKLGPLLYNIYTADMPTDNDRIQTLQYADDTMLTCTHGCPIVATRQIQKHMTNLLTYYDKWGIRVNPTKTELIVLRPDNKHCYKKTTKKSERCRITINGNTVNAKSEVKYLGVILDSRLTFKNHIKNAIRKAQIAYSKIRPLMNRIGLDLKVRTTLYKQLIRPILTYAVPAWMKAEENFISKLQIYERKIIRSISGKHRKPNRHYFRNEEIYKDLDVVPLDKCIKKLLISHLGRVRLHDNKLVKNPVQISGKIKKYLSTRQIIKRITKN